MCRQEEMSETLLTLGALGSLGIAGGAGAFAWSTRSAVQRLTERANAAERQHALEVQSAAAQREAKRDMPTAGHELIGLADAARAQAEAMVRVAELSAQGLRASTGTYVFQLRDRFDEAFPVPQLGAAGGTWSVPGFDAPVETVIFHAGDRVRFTMSLVCNQAPLRRIITVRPGAIEATIPNGRHADPDPKSNQGTHDDSLSEAIVVAKTRFVATAAQTLEGESFEIASDTTIFAEIGVDFDLAALGIGRFVVDLPVVIQVANNRPEGAVSELMVGVHIEGTVVPDDDGFGLDAATGDATISGELRSYYLDKVSRLPLAMPTDAVSVPVSVASISAPVFSVPVPAAVSV
jgi:hypothetical protein